MNRDTILIILSFFLVAFFATSHLVESPPTWMDEGIITQVSKNIAEYGIHGIQVAPGEFVSAGFVSTGYPVTFPIAMVYQFFGVGIVQSRSVMVLFIFSLMVLTWLFVRQSMSPKVALVSTLLLGSFAPLYGHGKNVLGEIPGLVYLFAPVLFCLYIEKSKSRKASPYISCGLFLGLTIACKPIFILLLPALIVSIFLYRKRLVFSRGIILAFSSGLILPLLIWVFVQFDGDSFVTMFRIYANPHNSDLWQSVFLNLKRFVTEAQPLYALILFVAWFLSLATRLKKRNEILFSETLLFLFSTLIMLAYLRTVGYYRYFFLAEFISLMYLPQTLLVFWPKKVSEKVLFGGVALLIIFQLYQTQFHSFVSDSKTSLRSNDLAAFAKTIGPGKTIFVYQAPELVTFLKNNQYYQYMDVTTTIHVGEDQLPVLRSGGADLVFVNSDIYEVHPALFTHYNYGRKVDRYIVLSLLK